MRKLKEDYMKQIRIHKGIITLILSIIFNIAESSYFGRDTVKGFNWFPQSIGEVVCDGISLILFILGLYWLKYSDFIKFIYKNNSK